jgi:hypothetical protein
MQGHGEAMPIKPLSAETTAKLNLVLLKCATRAERNNVARHAEQLARDVARLNDELARV